MNQVTLFTKPGCHLCDAVEQIILSVKPQRSFEFSRRNILDDAVDFQKYQSDIPVVLIDGREVARHRMTVQQFIAALDAKN
jgi:glutaredoxin